MKLFKFGFIISFIVLILTGCKSDWKDAIEADSLENIIEKGLESEQINEEKLLHIEEINNERIVFFTKYDALGIANISTKNGKWYWIRKKGYIDFQPENSVYMAAGYNFKTLNENEYFIALGKIFDPSIKRLTINNDSVEATIKTYQNNTFWFAILDRDASMGLIRLYDDQGNLLNE